MTVLLVLLGAIALPVVLGVLVNDLHQVSAHWGLRLARRAERKLPADKRWFYGWRAEAEAAVDEAAKGRRTNLSVLLLGIGCYCSVLRLRVRNEPAESLDLLEEDGVSVGWFGRAWIVGVFAFSIARALIAWPTLAQYGVSPWAFLLVDIATAFPYALGQVKVVNGFRQRAYAAVQLWALVVGATFLAPYLYIVIAGQERLPTIVYFVVALLASIFGTASVLRMRDQFRSAGR